MFFPSHDNVTLSQGVNLERSNIEHLSDLAWTEQYYSVGSFI